MPIPQTIRVNPLDLRKNIAIGVSLPFKGPFKSNVVVSPDIDSNSISITVDYKIVISSTPGQVTIQFETIR